jgi:hypothetical protein
MAEGARGFKRAAIEEGGMGAHLAMMFDGTRRAALPDPCGDA